MRCKDSGSSSHCARTCEAPAAPHELPVRAGPKGRPAGHRRKVSRTNMLREADCHLIFKSRGHVLGQVRAQVDPTLFQQGAKRHSAQARVVKTNTCETYAGLEGACDGA